MRKKESESDRIETACEKWTKFRVWKVEKQIKSELVENKQIVPTQVREVEYFNTKPEKWKVEKGEKKPENKEKEKSNVEKKDSVQSLRENTSLKKYRSPNESEWNVQMSESIIRRFALRDGAIINKDE